MEDDDYPCFSAEDWVVLADVLWQPTVQKCPGAHLPLQGYEAKDFPR